MSTRCYVGTTDPASPHLVHARFVLFDGHPAVVVATLARIWAGHAHHDTRALTTAVLAHDWEYLGRGVAALGARAAHQERWRRRCPGQEAPDTAAALQRGHVPVASRIHPVWPAS